MADLSGSDMSNCKLNNETNLSEADLRNSILKDMDLYLAKLDKTLVYYEDVEFAKILNTQLKGQYFSMQRKERIRIFISYSHSDSEFAGKLDAELRKNSIDVWIDRKEILVGDSLIEKIREGIDSSQYVCAVLSKNSILSSWVKNELDVAMNQQIENKEVKVLPLVIENDIELPLFLKGKLYIDFSRTKDFNDGVNQIMRRVNSRK